MPDLHSEQSLVPGLDDHPGAHAETEWPSTVTGRIELDAVPTKAIEPA